MKFGEPMIELKIKTVGSPWILIRNFAFGFPCDYSLGNRLFSCHDLANRQFRRYVINLTQNPAGGTAGIVAINSPSILPLKWIAASLALASSKFSAII